MNQSVHLRVWEGLLVFRNHERHKKHERSLIEIIFKEESYRIIEGCFEVYKKKGCGFPEAVYTQVNLLVNFGHNPKVKYERIVR